MEFLELDWGELAKPSLATRAVILRFDLRSMAATALVASGADIKTAQKRLGHSSSRMTLDIYARATGDADRAAADAVGRFLRPDR